MSDQRKVFAPASKKQKLVLMDNTTDVILTGGGAGGGKALKYGEKVLTPFGFKNIEDIQVADAVITPSNTVEYVTDVWPQGEVDIYRVTFLDGRFVDTCANHLWRYHEGHRFKVGTTSDMLRLINKGRRHPLIELCQPIDYRTPKVDLPIDPYTLGALLGNGTFCTYGSRITNSGFDGHIAERIRSSGVSVGREGTKKGVNAVCQSIGVSTAQVKAVGLYGTLSGTKFIPEVYKTASIEDRFALVQGLMDTDGYVSKTGKTYYDTVSEKLCEDLRGILNSLGFAVTVTTKIGHYRDKHGEKVLCQKVYRLYIKGKNQKRLFSLPRKVERCVDKSPRLKVVSITKVGRDQATCIAITGEEKLFLTTDFIVTHNSATCLMKNLDGIDDPFFRCTIFRRFQPELKRQGGLIDESKQFYAPFKGTYKKQAMTWEFPSGALISFAAIADDEGLESWLGSQLVRILIDEVGDKWTEKQVLFLLSRLRTTHSKINPQMILTCNPDSDSFLYTWLKDWALDPETGVAYEGIENRIRWFAVVDGTTHWGDDPDELYQRIGVPRGLVDVRKMSPEDLQKADATTLFFAKSFRFIPCTVFDNPYLLPPRNTTYVANLLAQPKQAQLKYLHGSWLKIGQGSGYFKREWCNMIDAPPHKDITNRARAYDLAATPAAEEGMPKVRADYTASVKMSRDKYGNYYIEDVQRFQKHSGKVIEEIIKVAFDDGIEDTTVIVPKDPGAGGTSFYQHLVRTLAENGVPSKPAKVSGHTGKMARTLPLCTIAESGHLYVVRGDWNEEFFTEMENFIPNNRKQHDDMWDAAGDCFNYIASQTRLPTFTLPDMGQTSPLAGIY